MKSPLFIGFEGLEPEWDRLERMNPLGVVLFQRNLESLEQVKELCHGIHNACPGTVIAIDQEGGRVNRLAHLLPAFPAPPEWKDEKTSFLAGKTMGSMLQALGIDMNFAPAIDLDYGEGDNALQGRYLGAQPSLVATLADAYLKGLTQSGCMGCLKHFPGLGTTKVDSHFHLPVFGIDKESWLKEEEQVYRMLFRGNWKSIPIMLAHCVVPFWNNEISSASSFAVNHLREIGSDGLLLTDDLEMKAVPESEWEIFCRNSLNAGVDLLMVCRSMDRAETLFDLCRSHQAKGPSAEERLNRHRTQVQVEALSLNEALDAWNQFV